MYYLIQLEQGDITIRKNFLKEGHKLVALGQILKHDNIKLISDDTELDKAGIYCVKHRNDCYRLFRYITEDDGYLFYGSKYQVDMSYLKFVYYVNEIDGLEGLTESLKQLGIKDKLEEEDRQEKVRLERLKDMEKKLETEKGLDV